MQYCHCCIHMCFCFLAANYMQEEHTHLGNRSPRASSSARSRSGTPLHKPRASYFRLTQYTACVSLSLSRTTKQLTVMLRTRPGGRERGPGGWAGG